MRIFTLVVGVISVIFVLSTFICGLWIKNNQNVDMSSIKFHMSIGSISTFLVVVFIIMAFKMLSKL